MSADIGELTDCDQEDLANLLALFAEARFVSFREIVDIVRNELDEDVRALTADAIQQAWFD